MSKNLKLSIALVVVAVVAVVGIATLRGDGDAPTSSALSRERLVRDHSPRLSEGTQATFVEFLDFECDACGALYPAIEQLRATYGDRVEFVVRYMPLHRNSVEAARAAEAAAEQGEFEAMYKRLFEAQAEWSHQEGSQEDVFFGYAEDLGLDMDRFRSAYDDPATLDRIEQSADDGRALGVDSTPTMFLDGHRLEPTSVADLVDSFDAALAD